MTRSTNQYCRQGTVSLLEVILVVAILMIVGLMVVPSIAGLYSNQRSVASSDMLRTKIAEARAYALEQGIQYNVLISPDFRSIRLQPDLISVSERPDLNINPSANTSQEDFPDRVTVIPQDDPEVPLNFDEESGWTIIAAVKPDGTCQSPYVIIEITDPDAPPGPPERYVIRGLTASIDKIDEQDGGVLP